MLVLVSDTSVLVDLERGALLDLCFELPFEFAVPDLLYRRELAEFGGDAMIARGLRIEELTGAELGAATALRRAHRKLSVPDAFAYALAESREWPLLTGDGELRALARAASIACHGTLWVIDRLSEHEVAEAAVLLAGLRAIAGHPRCRLPRTELQVRVDRYAAECGEGR